MCNCKNTCSTDCSASQPKTVCDLTPSSDVVWDGEDLLIGETIVATKNQNLNEVITNIVNEINNLHP